MMRAKRHDVADKEASPLNAIPAPATRDAAASFTLAPPRAAIAATPGATPTPTLFQKDPRGATCAALRERGAARAMARREAALHVAAAHRAAP